MGVRKEGFKGPRFLGYKEEHEGRSTIVPL